MTCIKHMGVVPLSSWCSFLVGRKGSQKKRHKGGIRVPHAAATHGSRSSRPRDNFVKRLELIPCAFSWQGRVLNCHSTKGTHISAVGCFNLPDERASGAAPGRFLRSGLSLNSAGESF